MNRAEAVAEAAGRVLAETRQEGECLVFTGTRTPAGYGMTSLLKRRISTHRLIWESVHGRIPDRMLVCHSCDNPPCVLIDHLWLGTHAENAQDMVAKSRSSHRPVNQGEANGRAKLTEADVREIRRLREKGTPVVIVAERFGIHPVRVSQITSRVAWRHVT